MGADVEDERRERLAVLGEIAAEIAHELRNVLQIIAASAYLARQEIAKKDLDATAPHITKIERNARLAHGIVDDLMTLARGERLFTEPTLVADLVVAARTDLPEGAAIWQDFYTPTDIRAEAHAGLAVRLLHILYDNAIHASAPRAPVITTKVWAEGDTVVIEVGDDGPGIPPELAPRIFEPLVTARPGGTGLGLALARRIVAAHGGSIELLDRPGGATFRLTFPAPGSRSGAPRT